MTSEQMRARVKWTSAFVGELLARKSMRVALVLLVVSSVVLMTFRVVNPGQGAEHYYMRENQVMYRLMQLCHVVIVVSVLFNVRYIMSVTASAVLLALK
jgi:hypothetical protein